jgi:hypothetical protein
MGLPAVSAIAKSIQKRLTQAAATPHPNAWKVREAAVYALGNLTEEFFDGRMYVSPSSVPTRVLYSN